VSDKTLRKVIDLFQEWRQMRTSRVEPIPEALWDLAVGLYPEYKRSKICGRLRLSASDFKKRLISAGKLESSDGFVLAAADAKPVVQSADDIKLTIQGRERILQFSVNVHALDQVLPHIGVLL